MKITYNRAITIENKGCHINLDPKRIMDNAVVTHGHMDHLKSGALMTPPTLDILRVRKGKGEGEVLDYNRKMDYHGFEVMFKNAGHVLGSAMVKVNDVLYTGDFNPEDGIIHDRAVPCPCETLVVEATYGKPDMIFPSRSEVIEDMLSWTESFIHEAPVVLCGYEFGKAQELIALLNKLKVPVFVPEKIVQISDIYNKYGVELKYEPLDNLDDHVSCGIVVPRRLLKEPLIPKLERVKEMGARIAFASGWCSFFNFRHKYNLDAQFPLSDHADYNSLMWFIEQCRPEKVYTVHGYAKELAQQVESELGIPAEPLGK